VTICSKQGTFVSPLEMNKIYGNPGKGRIILPSYVTRANKAEASAILLCTRLCA
jgi:hypothetical protein